MDSKTRLDGHVLPSVRADNIDGAAKVECKEMQHNHIGNEEERLDDPILKRGREVFKHCLFPKFTSAPNFLLKRLEIVFLQRYKRLSLQLSDLTSSESNQKVSSNSHEEGTGQLLESKDSAVTMSETTEVREEAYPALPQPDTFKLVLECPTCIPPLSSTVAERYSCRQHVEHDLKPYLCVLETCSNPEITFSSPEEWIRHMNEEQGNSVSELFTSCPMCSKHCMKKAVDEEFTGDISETFEAHLGDHMLNMALHSIPGRPSQNEPASKSQGSSLNPLQSSFSIGPPVNPLWIRSHSNLMHPPSFSQMPPPPPPPATQPYRTFTSPNTNLQSQIPALLLPSKDESYTVLHAEDNHVNQRLMNKILGKLQHTNVTVSNGQEAVDAFKKRKFDIVLMDIHMPIMGGFEAAERIRAYELEMGVARTPIVALFAHSSQLSSPWYGHTGMDDFICKPIKMRALAETISHYGRLGRRETEGEMWRLLEGLRAGMGSGRKGGEVARL